MMNGKIPLHTTLTRTEHKKLLEYGKGSYNVGIGNLLRIAESKQVEVTIITKLVLLILLLVGQASAAYLQVQNGSTIQASNDTVYQQDATVYTNTSTLIIPVNIYGTFNITYDYRSAANLLIMEAKLVINGIDVSGGNAASDSATWSTKTIQFSNTYANTTDSYILQARSADGNEQAQVRNFRLKYDYVPAPAILSPVNNSVQTSRIVNITWNGTAPFQYQVSQVSDFSTLLFNVTTSNNFSGNLTLPTGWVYFRAKGYNVTTNAGTNFSNITQVKIMSNIYDINTSGLVGWWHLDDNKLDSSVSYNNLTLVGGADNYTSGHLNNGSYLNASQSSYYNTSNTSTYNIENNTPFTMVIWTKFSDSTHASIRQYLFSNLGANLGGYEWYYQNGVGVGFALSNVSYGSKREIRESSVINDSKFHMLAISYNGTGNASGINYYVDSIKKTPTVIDDALSGTSISDKPMFIGSRPYDNYGYYTGTVDESLFYNRALTQNEITQLYYNITYDNNLPIISSWGNNNTNNNALNISIYNGTTVLFNVTVNQSIINGYWNGSTYIDSTNSSKLFDTVGNFTVDYYAQTNNGTTDKLQWNITVDPIPVSFIYPTITSGREDWNKNSTTIKIQGIKNISSATLYWYPRVWEPSVYSMTQENATIFSKNFTFDEDDRFSYWVNVSFQDGTYYELGKGDGYLYIHSKNNISYFKTTFKPFSASNYNRLKIRYKSFVGGAEFIGLAWTNLGVDCEYEGAPCYQNYYIPNDNAWHVLEENITAGSWRENIDLLRFNPWNVNSSFSGDFLVDYVQILNSSNVSDYIEIDNFSYPNYQLYWGGAWIDNNLTQFSNPWVQLDRTMKSNVVGSNVFLHQRSDGSYYSSVNHNETGMNLIEFEWMWGGIPSLSINRSFVNPIYRCYYSTGGFYYDDTDCGANSSTQIGTALNVTNIHAVPLKVYKNTSGYKVTLADRVSIPNGYVYEKTLGYVLRGYMHQEDMIYLNSTNVTMGIDKKTGAFVYLSNGSEENLINTLNSGRFAQFSTYRIGTFDDPTDIGYGEYFYFDMNPSFSTKYNEFPDNITITNSSSNIRVEMDYTNYNPDWGNYKDSRMNIILNYSIDIDPHVVNIEVNLQNERDIYYGNNPHQYPGIALRPKYTNPWYHNGTSFMYIGQGIHAYPSYYSVPSALFLALLDINNASGIGTWNWGRPPGYFGTDSNDSTLTSWDQFLNGMSNNVMHTIDPFENYTIFSKIYLGNATDMFTYFGGLQYNIIFVNTSINRSIAINSINIQVDTTDLGEIKNATLNWKNNTGNYSLIMTVNVDGTSASFTMSGLTEQNFTYNVSSYSIAELYAVTDTVWTNYDITPPVSITNLQNTTNTSSVNWTWTDPADADFDHVEVYVNNSWITNVTAGIRYYLNTSFSPNTDYTISTRTVDTVGNVNQTWVNQTTRTLNYLIPCKPTITSNTTTSTSIRWDWVSGC